MILGYQLEQFQDRDMYLNEKEYEKTQSQIDKQLIAISIITIGFMSIGLIDDLLGIKFKSLKNICLLNFYRSFSIIFNCLLGTDISNSGCSFSRG